MTIFVRTSLLATGLLLLSLGCGETAPTLVDVSGKVTYKGKPVPCGMVVFLASDGKSRGVGPIGTNGQYSLKSPMGNMKVAVVTRPADPNSVNDPDRPAVRDVVIPAGVDVRTLPPEKYQSFNKSGLTAEVKSSSQTIDFPLD